MSDTDPGNAASQRDGAELLAAATATAVEKPGAEVDAEDSVVADFEADVWEPAEQRYGMVKLMGIREAMLPIEKPAEIKALKFLFFPGYGLQDDEPEENKDRERRSEARRAEGKTDRGDRPDRGDRGDRGDRNKGKGKGKGSQQQPNGRFVPEMGKTELQPDYKRNQWYRNTASNELAVIVREGFSLMSQEIWKVPHGHYVLQSAPSEIFVSGQATGLTRMPVFPRGWVTADASTVGGPLYLERVRGPRWKVSFQSDSPKGDILVRESVSLESEEVGCICFGAFVNQSGPQETLEDGIIRMPISWTEGATAHRGWVTCDASSQGGPKFFTASPEEEDPSIPPPPPPAPEIPERREAPASGSAHKSKPGGEDGITTWDKNRIWKVENLDVAQNRSLPLVSRSEPYAPGTGRVPAEDLVVRWMSNDELVEQIGHSKKTRGYMVMPVRVIKDAEGKEVKGVEGWVTRRLVDKQRDPSDLAWLTEIRDDDEQADRERRRSERKEKREKA